MPAKAAKNVVFQKNLNNVLLTIQAPQSYISGNKKIFIDKQNNFEVVLSYDEIKIYANQIAYDFNLDTIELSNGFKGSLEQYFIRGDYFRINLRTRYYVGNNLQFGYQVASLQGEEFQFYGDRILVKNITASPLYYPIFNLTTSRLEIYPSYSLAKLNTLRFFRIPFYFIFLYMEDWRRNYFELPFPALELKKDIFHDTSGTIHTHYFINPSLYGDIALKLSDKDGGGAQIQQIVRLNDHHQMELKVLGWERAPAQANFSYIFHFFDNPRKPDKYLSFEQKQKMEQRVSRIEPNLIFQCDYTYNEEIQRSIVDRYPDAMLMGNIRGILYDHTYTLTPAVHYGRIKEKRIYPENQNPRDVDRDYKRLKGEANFTYYLETPRLSPFINRVFLGIDYEHSEYTPGDANRGRILGSLTVRRPILKMIGLYYELKLNKALLDYGQSPFFFEEYGRLMDSAALDLYLQLQLFIAGNQFIYDITNMQPYNEVYYVGVKAGINYAVIQYNRREQSWEFKFMRKEAAF